MLESILEKDLGEKLIEIILHIHYLLAYGRDIASPIEDDVEEELQEERSKQI